MLVTFNNFSVINNSNIINNSNRNGFKHNTLKQDTLTFRGISKPSQYGNVFEFLSAEILDKKKTTTQSNLSAENIKKAPPYGGAGAA